MMVLENMSLHHNIKSHCANLLWSLFISIYSLIILPKVESVWQIVLYTVFGYTLTELGVWLPCLYFEYYEQELEYCKIRKNINDVLQKRNDSMIKRQIELRLENWKKEWVIYLTTFLLSDMDFNSTCPGVLSFIFQFCGLVVLLDLWIFLVHGWLHTHTGSILGSWSGYKVHKEHHQVVLVSCWLVDHEDPLESLGIGIGKHGLLAFFSPHPYVAFAYLLFTKFWNCICHCGYNIPLFQFIDRYLPFISTPNQHEKHHYNHDDTNLCVFVTFFDYLAGTLS